MRKQAVKPLLKRIPFSSQNLYLPFEEFCRYWDKRCRSAWREEFSLANWQMFIESMHEKQVLLYFFVDREGSAVKEAARFSGKKRRSPFDRLEIVIPPERIHVWATSYEEANFTDGEIARALAK